MDMQIIVDLLFDEVAYIFINSISIWRHHSRTQLDFRLAFEDWFFHINSDGCNNTCSNVAILIFAKEFLDGLGDMLLKGTLVGSTLGGMLAIDE